MLASRIILVFTSIWLAVFSLLIYFAFSFSQLTCLLLTFSFSQLTCLLLIKWKCMSSSSYVFLLMLQFTIYTWKFTFFSLLKPSPGNVLHVSIKLSFSFIFLSITVQVPNLIWVCQIFTYFFVWNCYWCWIILLVGSLRLI